MAAQGAFGTDFYDRSILRPKHLAYRSGRPVIIIGLKGALGSYEIRPIHSAPSLGQSIGALISTKLLCLYDYVAWSVYVTSIISLGSMIYDFVCAHSSFGHDINRGGNG